jgi:3-phosphoshikimate 1-carboxyvinyltransferase
MATNQLADTAAGDAIDWLVPTAPGPVDARVRLPGSKSMTNRALVLAALADAETEIIDPLIARDTTLMADGLRALGCEIAETAGRWRVTPLPTLTAQRGRAQIDVGNAGTVLRFLPPVAALTGLDVRFIGDRRVSERPVGPLLTALASLGGQFSTDGANAVPFTVHGQGQIAGGTVTLDASASSQLISGLLLSAPRFAGGAQVRHEGPPVPSVPHIEMTVAMLAACGAQVQVSAEPGPAQTAGPARTPSVSNIWKVFPGPISPGQLVIEPDLSNAVPFLAAALATGGRVTVADWPEASVQPAARIIEVLAAMGADVRRTAHGLQVTGSGAISGIGADLSAVGELTPVLTALAALAGSPSEFTGIGHLRRHETDRLAALAGEIGKLGGDVTELADGLRINPAPLRADGVVFDSHDDHRLVMAAAVLGLVTDGLLVRNAATVGKTFPGFSRYWAATLAPAG